jgi:hypothetical protein
MPDPMKFFPLGPAIFKKSDHTTNMAFIAHSQFLFVIALANLKKIFSKAI